MKEEVKSAGEFLAKLLYQSQNNSLSQEKATNFSRVLQTLLCNHYLNHWFPEKPFKGSAYRCLRINSNKMEPLLVAACKFSGLTDSEFDGSLPCELTLWIDPREVSYRIGENGSVCVLYSENGNSMDQSDDGDTDSSLGSSPGTSPSKSPVHFQSPVVNGNHSHVTSSSNSRNRRRQRANFQRTSPTSVPDVQSGCTDPWYTHDQSHNIQKLEAYVYS